MRHIVLFSFLLILCSCIALPDKQKADNFPKKPQMVQADLTEWVEGYKNIVRAEIDYLKHNYSPTGMIMDLDRQIQGNKTIREKNFSCITNKVNITKNRVRVGIEKEYSTFLSKLKAREREILPYHKFIIERLKFEIISTLNLDSLENDGQLSNRAGIVFDIGRLDLNRNLKKNEVSVKPLIREMDQDATYTFSINYDHFYHKPFSGHKTEPKGKDIFHLDFSTQNGKKIVTIKYRRDISSNVVLDPAHFFPLFKKILTDEKRITRENSLTAYVAEYKTNTADVRNELKDLTGQVNKKVELLSSIQNEEVFCILFDKKLTQYMNNESISIKKISLVKYKDKSYLNQELIHLNILNSANIKLNDSYKIARYLFDKIVRPGVRTFSEVLSSDSVDGISFEILSFEKNFVTKDDQNFVIYKFFLPEKEIQQYINDDITGQMMADASYILVDGERIELR